MTALSHPINPPAHRWQSRALLLYQRPLSTAPTASITAAERFPRRLEPEQLRGLLDSIASIGVQTPLLVSDEGDGTYQLIDGQRRLIAAQQLGLATVPIAIATDILPGDAVSGRKLYMNTWGDAEFIPSEVGPFLEHLRHKFGYHHDGLRVDLRVLALQQPRIAGSLSITALFQALELARVDAVRVLAAYTGLDEQFVSAYEAQALKETEFVALYMGQEPRAEILLRALRDRVNLERTYEATSDELETIDSLLEQLGDWFEELAREYTSEDPTALEQCLFGAVTLAASLKQMFVQVEDKILG